MWPSVRDAAKNLGVMPSTVRDNLAGKNTPILGDRHLVNLGENLDGIRP
jgi:hypothetical protein